MQLTLRLHLADGRTIRVQDPDEQKILQEENPPGVFRPLSPATTLAGPGGLLAQGTTVEVLWGDQVLTSFLAREWDEPLRTQGVNVYVPTWLARLLTATAEQRQFTSRHAYIIHLLLGAVAQDLAALPAPPA